MDPKKAKILDAILMKFEGHKIIRDLDLKKGLWDDDIAEYETIDSHIKFLIGEGMLEKRLHSEYNLTDKGFGVMSDIGNIGYVAKVKKELTDKLIKVLMLLIGLATLSLVTIDFFDQNNQNDSDKIESNLLDAKPIIPDTLISNEDSASYDSNTVKQETIELK